MTHSKIVRLEIAAVDFLVIFAVFLLSRKIFPGVFPRWFYLALSSLLWVLCGLLTHKLEFWRYRDRKRALWTVASVDIVVYAFCFAGWLVLFPERGITAAQLWPLPMILAIECSLYLIWRFLFRKVPYLYVDNIDIPFHERGIEKAVHYQDGPEQNEDLAAIFEATKAMSPKEVCKWVKANASGFSSGTLIVDEGTPEELQKFNGHPSLIVCLKRINDIRHFNTFLIQANELLQPGGTLAVYGVTSGMRRHKILSSYPPVIAQVVVLCDYIWTRVCSKLVLSRKLYMSLSKGRKRNFPRVEILGRIARAGFEICGDEIRNGGYYVTARQKKAPTVGKPHYGLFIRLPRKGKDGKIIGVFKMRTMYAYSEYIQDYTYKLNGLEVGGKLKDDFRVNMVGKFCRSRFLDELPMFFNFFKGDLKFVGVRPLSKHYLSLYTPEMQAIHLSVKPGIFPPFYYDYPEPKTLEEIQESERRYIELYNQRPFHTDWIYFWGMVRNILFRKERSH